MLTLNGLCSAHGVIVPMQCEYFALEGLTDLVNTIKQVHANLNADLQIIGLLRVMFDPRITLQQQVSEQLKDHFGDKVFHTVIPRNVRLAEAPSYGLPGVVFDPQPRAARPSWNLPRKWWTASSVCLSPGIPRSKWPLALDGKAPIAIKIVVMKSANILLLPGWQNSEPAHWQSRWEAQHGYQRVEQHDWMRRCGRLDRPAEELVVDADGPVVLVAHSLGCILTAWWAAHSQHTAKVRVPCWWRRRRGAARRGGLDSRLGTHRPQALPFPSLLVGSRNDPYCRFERAQGLASDWGALHRSGRARPYQYRIEPR